MFKVGHNFSFSLTNNEKVEEVVGQLIFKSNELNEFGSVNTQAELEGFSEQLNTISGLPSYWTLEILSKELFSKIKPLFKNLDSLNLSLKDFPDRVVEYNEDFEFNGETQWKN